MITIIEATIQDLSIIERIAHKTWPLTYGQILSQEQMQFMLQSFYSIEKLQENIEQSGHHFILVKEDEKIVGFASFEPHYNNEKATKIHKIYLLPESQGKGIGQKMIDYIGLTAKENNFEKLLLNVNRFNKALGFYQKIGFSIIEEVDIEIGQGYLMEDFVMAKKL